jgi:hypothetical protein
MVTLGVVALFGAIAGALLWRTKEQGTRATVRRRLVYLVRAQVLKNAEVDLYMERALNGLVAASSLSISHLNG